MFCAFAIPIKFHYCLDLRDAKYRGETVVISMLIISVRIHRTVKIIRNVCLLILTGLWVTWYSFTNKYFLNEYTFLLQYKNIFFYFILQRILQHLINCTSNHNEKNRNKVVTG